MAIDDDDLKVVSGLVGEIREEMRKDLFFVEVGDDDRKERLFAAWHELSISSLSALHFLTKMSVAIVFLLINDADAIRQYVKRCLVRGFLKVFVEKQSRACDILVRKG